MIKRLLIQVVETISTTGTVTPEDREAALRLATAVLMVDVARADYVFDEAEFDQVLRLVESHFGLSAEQAAELVNEAGDNQAEVLVFVSRNPAAIAYVAPSVPIIDNVKVLQVTD